MKRALTLALLVLLPCTAGAASLPKPMLGVWATDLAACSEQASEIKMTVEPRTVLMYEVAYTVKRIVRQRDGFLRVSGDSVTDDGRAPHSLLLRLTGDRLQVGKTDGQIYRRCRSRAEKGCGLIGARRLSSRVSKMQGFAPQPTDE